MSSDITHCNNELISKEDTLNISKVYIGGTLDGTGGLLMHFQLSAKIF